MNNNTLTNIKVTKDVVKLLMYYKLDTDSKNLSETIRKAVIIARGEK